MIRRWEERGHKRGKRERTGENTGARGSWTENIKGGDKREGGDPEGIGGKIIRANRTK